MYFSKPEDWVEKKIGALVLERKTGLNIKPSQFSKNKNDYTVIHKGDIQANGKILLTERDSRHVDEQTFKDSPGSVVDNSYLVVTLRDLVPTAPTLGLISSLPIGKGLLAQGTYGFLVDDNVVDKSFLIHFSNSYEYRKTMKRLCVGSTQVHLRSTEFFDLKIPFPCLKEQKAISNFLSMWDDQIDVLGNLLLQKRKRKKVIAQNIFDEKIKLKSYSGKWKEKKLGDVGECIRGLTYSPDNISSDGLLVLRSSNIRNSRLSFIDNVYVDMELDEKYYTQQNDILLCVRNGSRRLIGKSALVTKAISNTTHGAFMSIFRSKHGRFIYQLFQSNEFFKQVNRNLGATINSINNSDLIKFKFKFPTEGEMKDIVELLEGLDREIDVIERLKSKVEFQKAGIMQELITGKKRLKIS